jgi:hypothetical protein
MCVYHPSGVGVLRRRLRRSSSYPLLCVAWRCLLFKYCLALAWGLLFFIKLLLGFIYSSWGLSTSTSWLQDWHSPVFRLRVSLTWLGDLSDPLDQEVHHERSGQTSLIILVSESNFLFIGIILASDFHGLLSEHPQIHPRNSFCFQSYPKKASKK